MQHSTSEIYLKFHRISICKGGESWYIESQPHNITPYINKIRTRKHKQIHCCQLAMSPRGHWGERTQLCLVNQTLPSWIHLPQEEPTPTILQSLVILNLLICQYLHQFWTCYTLLSSEVILWSMNLSINFEYLCYVCTSLALPWLAQSSLVFVYEVF